MEKLLEEDATLYERGGTAGSAQTGEEYPQTLRKALDEKREGTMRLPRKASSGDGEGRSAGRVLLRVGRRTDLSPLRARRRDLARVE